MNKNRTLKKQYSEKITSKDLDKRISNLRTWCNSIKILGAGGGGYFGSRLFENNRTFMDFTKL